MGLNRYAAERSVELSGMNGTALPSEGLFNHGCRFRLDEFWRRGWRIGRKLMEVKRGRGTLRAQRDGTEGTGLGGLLLGSG